MDSKRIYLQIINRGKLEEIDRLYKRKKKLEYFETHHIVPRCLGGNDDRTNLVELTAREHFVCHWLLTKIHKDIQPRNLYHKLACAFHRMTHMSTKNQKHLVNSRMFQWAMKIRNKSFSENHPMKNPAIVAKMIETTARNRLNKPAKIVEQIKITCECECGCGETFNCNPKSKRRFLNKQHNIVTEESRLKMSNSAKNNLKTLTKEEMALRQKKSFGSCDQVEKGRRISLGKKGIKTNQKEIMGRNFAIMSDAEFEKHLIGKAKNVKTRFIGYRNLYINE